jgi:hypothetical protein
MSYARVVPAFEEVNFVEQASGEEQSPVGFGPNVGVVLSGGDGHVLVFEDLNKGWHMPDLILHMS